MRLDVSVRVLTGFWNDGLRSKVNSSSYDLPDVVLSTSSDSCGFGSLGSGGFANIFLLSVATGEKDNCFSHLHSLLVAYIGATHLCHRKLVAWIYYVVQNVA